MSDHPTIPLNSYREYPLEEMQARLEEFYEECASLWRNAVETRYRIHGKARTYAELGLALLRQEKARGRKAWQRLPIVRAIECYRNAVLRTLSRQIRKEFDQDIKVILYSDLEPDEER